MDHSDDTWIGLAEVSPTLFSKLNCRPLQVIRVFLEESHGGHGTMPIPSAALIQVLPLQNSTEGNDQRVHLHPLLYQVLVESAQFSFAAKDVPEKVVRDKHPGKTESHSVNSAMLAPLPLVGYDVKEIAAPEMAGKFSIASVVTRVLPSGCVVVLRIVYCESEEPVDWEWSLTGRVLQEDTTLLLNTVKGMVIAVIVHIYGDQGQSRLDPTVAYRVSDPRTFQVRLEGTVATAVAPLPLHDVVGATKTCPGYESLVKEVVALIKLSGPSAPSAVLLTGCPGVGKTRLAKAVASSVDRIHWVSVQDLLLAASWMSEEDMLDRIVPNQADTHRVLLVLDDLHVLENEDSTDEPAVDQERRLVSNSLAQAIDRLSGTAILAVTREAQRLSPALTRTGRLEKLVDVLAPTQAQRQTIMNDLLQQTLVPHKLRDEWATWLASVTPGCVAADLERLLVDACTRAAARRDGEGLVTPEWKDVWLAAQQCVPSQLAALDVTKPVLTADVPDHDWNSLHSKSWSRFAGYEKVKQRIYRTVVVPWRRRLSLIDQEESSGVAAPSGVLFHGPSGSGKTLAANCLGSSLGLPMIQVRASSVLDKWLGGSEAAIRSLFARARAAAPCILFFDEIDSIANNRSLDGDTADVMSRLLSTLLNEMDGVSTGQISNVLVVACTNRLDALDSALLRPGRLDEHIALESPTAMDAKSILQLHLSRAPVQDDVSLDDIVETLVSKNCSAADLEGLCREAALRALRRTRSDPATSIATIDIVNAMSALRL